jgi:hypothetical protein
MSVTQIVRSTQLKPGTAKRVVINDANGKMADNAALTASRALASDSDGLPVASATTDTELGYVSGVTSSIQTQLGTKKAIATGNSYKWETTGATGDLQETTVTASRAVATDANGLPVASATTATELGYVNGVTSAIQTQFTGKLSLTGGTMSGAIAMGTNKITGMGNPTLDQDAATKIYVDSVAQGLNIHSPADYGTIGALPAVTGAGSQASHTLTANANGELSIDGNSTWFDIVNDLSVNDNLLPLGAGPGFRASRVLVKNQVNAVNNGIYAVQDKGSLKATGTITVTDNAALSGATVTVNAVVLTEGVEWTRSVGDANATAASIASAITTATATTLCTATSATNVVTITANTGGTAGNSIALASSQVVYLLVSGANLGGGTDAPFVLVRYNDFNGVPAGEVSTGDFVFVALGTVNTGSGWVVTSGTGVIVVDTGTIVWSQFSQAAAYTAGNGINITGTVIKLADFGTSGNILVGSSASGAPAASVAMSGEATIINTGAVTLSNAAVIGKVLTGFVSGAGAVTSSDSILAAIQHLDGNVALKVAKAGDTMTGALTINPATNQLILGGVSGGKKVTITSPEPALDRVLTIPIATGNRNFLLSGEAQIVAADISATAAIALSQLASIGDGNIIVGAVTTGTATAVAMSGDVTITNTGVTAVASSFLKDSRIVTRENPPALGHGLINSSNRVFTLVNTPELGTESVYLNGILQNSGAGNDYQIASGTITFESGNEPQTGSVLLVSYIID